MHAAIIGSLAADPPMDGKNKNAQTKYNILKYK